MKLALEHNPARHINRVVPQKQAYRRFLTPIPTYPTPNYYQHNKTPYSANPGLFKQKGFLTFTSAVLVMRQHSGQTGFHAAFLAQPQRRKIFRISLSRYSCRSLFRDSQIGFFNPTGLCSVTGNTGTKSTGMDFYRDNILSFLQGKSMVLHCDKGTIFWEACDVD